MSLRRERVSGFEELGDAELIEPTIGQVRALKNQAEELHGDVLLSRCLLIDGEPIGLEALNNLGFSKFRAVSAATTRLTSLAGFDDYEADSGNGRNDGSAAKT